MWRLRRTRPSQWSAADDAPTSGHERDILPRAAGIRDEDVGFRTRRIFRRERRRYGLIPLSVRIRAHDPGLLNLCEQMNRHTSVSGAIALRLKELAQLKVAVMVGCPF